MREFPKQLGDMPPDEFRGFGKQVVERIARYFEDLDEYPVLSQNTPGELSAALPESAPEQGEDFAAVLEDIDRLIMPAVTHWNHPNFHGLFSTSTSSVGVFGEMFAAAFDMKAMLWRTSPASTELEPKVLDWLRQMMGMPEYFKGLIYDTASISTLHALAMARESLDLRIREDGMSGRTDLPLLRIFCSEHAHSSVDKAVLLLGLGKRALGKVPVNEKFEMDPASLEAAISADVAAGHRPCCVIATLGTTSTTSVDNVEAVGEVCSRAKVFLHVDAAYAGSAMILPELQHHLKGIERVDSLVTNPHKWLFTPFDLSVLYVKDLELLKRTFSLVADYLKVAESVQNQMDYGIQLGRRFRSLKLWFIIRYFGRQGLIDRIRDHIRLANLFADWIRESDDFELLAPKPFALVCFRACPHDIDDLDGLNERLMNDINSSGIAYISPTKLNGMTALRVSVGSIQVEERHLRKTWEALNSNLDRIRNFQ
ncbi:MAG: pyridoxal phosphate-dependent decarboxylase family protein [Acidobacteriota bacterium]